MSSENPFLSIAKSLALNHSEDGEAAYCIVQRLAAINVDSFTATYRHEPGLSFRTPEMVAVDHREDYSGSWAGVCDSDSHRERYGVDGDSPKMAEHRALCLLLAAAEARRLSGDSADV